MSDFEKIIEEFEQIELDDKCFCKFCQLIDHTILSVKDEEDEEKNTAKPYSLTVKNPEDREEIVWEGAYQTEEEMLEVGKEIYRYFGENCRLRIIEKAIEVLRKKIE